MVSKEAKEAAEIVKFFYKKAMEISRTTGTGSLQEAMMIVEHFQYMHGVVQAYSKDNNCCSTESCCK